MINRRGFFQSLTALGWLPFANRFANATPAGPDSPVWPKPTDPNYWPWIRQQFPIPPDEAYFNTGTLGARPRQVIDAVIDHMRENERTIAHFDYRPEHVEYIAGYRKYEDIRAKLGSLLNASGREIALVQNATVAISQIANGLELKAGDEVLLTDQEHSGGQGGWDLRAKRYGIVVKKIPIAIPAKEPEAILKSFADAITPRTRVIAVPHITSKYGIVLPVRQLCALGRQHGMFTLVDGAQAVGQLRVDVQEIGCDAYASSPHKWLFAPPGNGLLYVRESRMKDVWATIASGNWDNFKPEDGIFRLMQFGTGNLSNLVGLEAGLDFHHRVGAERCLQRIAELANRLRAGLQQINGVTIFSPVHPALACSIVNYGVDAVEGTKLMDELWSRKKIRVRAQGGTAVRQTSHIYNSPAEIDATLEIVAQLAKR
ncbi:MAG: aminotransferase class V-fold PLP-dependent enzyme [Blastocatellia bacterium]|nr:aminotransferase class V-fold PLP-dependent enzyme [Blastocatellia bacterium]